MGGPLLATSVHVPDTLAPDTEVPDAGTMWEQYRGGCVLPGTVMRYSEVVVLRYSTGVAPGCVRAVQG